VTLGAVLHGGRSVIRQTGDSDPGAGQHHQGLLLVPQRRTHVAGRCLQLRHAIRPSPCAVQGHDLRSRRHEAELRWTVGKYRRNH